MLIISTAIGFDLLIDSSTVVFNYYCSHFYLFDIYYSIVIYLEIVIFSNFFLFYCILIHLFANIFR